MAKVGNYRIFKSHSGKRWIIQVRGPAIGLWAALVGAISEWHYTGFSFRTEKEAKQKLQELNK